MKNLKFVAFIIMILSIFFIMMAVFQPGTSKIDTDMLLVSGLVCGFCYLFIVLPKKIKDV